MKGKTDERDVSRSMQQLNILLDMNMILFHTSETLTENVLMTNEMHNSYNQFFIPQFFVCSKCFQRI